MSPTTWKPGQSGNPSGRPKQNPLAQELARAYTEQAVQALAEILGDPEADQRAKIAAAQALLDRAWGKPAQTLLGDPESPLLVHTIERRLVRADTKA
jgi:hypothetical protein